MPRQSPRPLRGARPSEGGRDVPIWVPARARALVYAAGRGSCRFLKGRVEALVPTLVAAYGCNGTVEWVEEEHPSYPPLVNDAHAVAFTRGIAEDMFGADKVRAHAKPSTPPPPLSAGNKEEEGAAVLCC